MSATKYRAIIIIGEHSTQVFPHSKKTSLFTTPAEAERALDLRGRRMVQDCRGHIIGTDGTDYYMAL